MGKLLTVLAAVLVLLLAACSGGDSEEADVGLATLETTDTTAASGTDEGTAGSEGDAEAALVEFAQCMRSNGFPDYPDPTLNPDGSISFGGVLGQLEDSGIDPQSDDFRAALDVCGDRLQGVALGLIGEQFDLTELQDTLLAFAQCMREQGIPMDDPDLSEFSGNFGEGGGPFADIDFDDPEVQAATEICQREVVFPGLSSPPEGEPGGE